MTAPITGTVTDGRTGLADVVVSNGHDVTTTDADGHWTLPGPGRFVTVTRPTGWTTDTWWLPGDADTFDFVLQPQEQPLPFTFVQVTDLHVSLGSPEFGPGQGDATIWLGTDGQLHERIVTTPGVLDELWRDIDRQVPDAALVMATGDLTNTGAEGEYAAYVASMTGSPVPVVSIPGNHDHHAQGDELPEGTAADFHAETSRYEAALGPRWFSFDHAGVHVVAIDWFTHLLGIDAEQQEAWLHADLALAPQDRPVVLLSHDLMSSDFFARLPRQPIATFSGHWHTSRVARVNGTLHVNTPTATFGGIDYSPAAMRVARWDGEQLTLETIARGHADTDVDPSLTYAATRRGATAPTLATRLPGAGHRAAPVVADGLVLATSRDEDAARGWVTAVDAASGEVAWQVEVDAPVKAAPTPLPDGVVVVDVTGVVTCLDRAGAVRWLHRVDDPLRLWTYLRPAVHDGLVFTGDVARFVALDAADGTVAWARSDLGQRENLMSCGDPVVVDDTLLVAFAGQNPVLWGLDPRTGEARWPDAPRGSSIYRGPAGEVIVHLPRTIVAPPVADPDGRDVYVVRLGAALERLGARDGAAVWTTAHHGWFNPGTPAIVGDLVVAMTGQGRARAYDRATGTLAWDVEVESTPAPIAAGAYRGHGTVALGGLATAGEMVVAGLGSGRVVTLDVKGEVAELADVGAPVLATPAVGDSVAWAATADGGLHRVPLG